MDLPLLLRSAIEFQQYVADRAFEFCAIGGIAVNRWGEPRGTRDVDFMLFTGFGNEEAFINDILAGFEPRITDSR
jgi:hypothetical protein